MNSFHLPIHQTHLLALSIPDQWDLNSGGQSGPTARQTWHSSGSNYRQSRREASLNGEQHDEVDVVQLPSSPLGHLLPCLQ